MPRAHSSIVPTREQRSSSLSPSTRRLDEAATSSTHLVRARVGVRVRDRDRGRGRGRVRVRVKVRVRGRVRGRVWVRVRMLSSTHRSSARRTPSRTLG